MSLLRECSSPFLKEIPASVRRVVPVIAIRFTSHSHCGIVQEHSGACPRGCASTPGPHRQQAISGCDRGADFFPAFLRRPWRLAVIQHSERRLSNLPEYLLCRRAAQCVAGMSCPSMWCVTDQRLFRGDCSLLSRSCCFAVCIVMPLHQLLSIAEACPAIRVEVLAAVVRLT